MRLFIFPLLLRCFKDEGKRRDLKEDFRHGCAIKLDENNGPMTSDSRLVVELLRNNDNTKLSTTSIGFVLYFLKLSFISLQSQKYNR